MSIAITAGAQPSLAGLGVKDPEDLQWSFSLDDNVQVNYGTGTTTNSGSGTFWTYVSNAGDYVTGMTNDTYSTLVDISGSDAGFLTTVIGPKTDVFQTFTTTMKITVDGTEYEFSSDAVYSGGNPARVLLGAVTENTVIGIGPNGGDEVYARTYQPSIVDPFTSFQAGKPYLNFNTSLKVEIKSDNLDVTSAIAAYAGCLWRYYK